MGVIVKERTKGSGVWWIFINHKGVRKAKKFGRDKKEAITSAKKIEARLALGDMNLEKSGVKPPTLKGYIYGWRDEDGRPCMGWLDRVASLSLKNSTYHSYRLIIDTHLVPAFGSKMITEINPRMISDFVGQEDKKGHAEFNGTQHEELPQCNSAPCRKS